jgi:hypothetical protein
MEDIVGAHDYRSCFLSNTALNAISVGAASASGMNDAAKS